MLMNTRRLAIEWGDCDPAGIVHYPCYFAMLVLSGLVPTGLFGRSRHRW